MGERLALTALKLAYHENVIHSGPSLLSSEIKDHQIILTFENIGNGLKTKDGEPIGDLAIAGADKKFVWAKSKIEGNKVIVWATFKENYRMIAELCDKIGIKYREIHGDISHNQRQINMNDFRKDPEVRVMIANQSAGGTGINLIEASYSIYYSKGFKLEDVDYNNQFIV